MDEKTFQVVTAWEPPFGCGLKGVIFCEKSFSLSSRQVLGQRLLKGPRSGKLTSQMVLSKHTSLRFIGGGVNYGQVYFPSPHSKLTPEIFK